MTVKCKLCGKGIDEISGYLHRVNEKGVEGIWECRPSCDADLSQETNLLLALEGEPTAPTMTYEELLKVAQYLYQLLDDIDAAGDMAKGDDKLFREIVERTQTKKGAVVAECDGYTVTLKPLPTNA